MKNFNQFINNDAGMVRATIYTVKSFIIGLTFLTICGFLFKPIKIFVEAQDFSTQTINAPGLIETIVFSLNAWYVALIFIPLSGLLYLFLRAFILVEVSKTNEIQREEYEESNIQ